MTEQELVEQELTEQINSEINKKLLNTIQDITEKLIPCNEYITFDKNIDTISKDDFIYLVQLLVKLFSLDYTDSLLLYYNNEYNEWRSLISKDRIKKEKLSEINYEIHYDAKEPAWFKTKTLYVIVRRKIKECYKHEFEPHPIFLKYDLSTTNTPVIGNFIPDRNINSKYFVKVPLSYYGIIKTV